MNKAKKMVVVLLMVFGAVSVSFGAEIKDWKEYKELKAWIEDMKPHLKANKWTDPETIEEYGEYPRLKIFMNDLEFLDDLDVERAKKENKDKNPTQLMRALSKSPKWKCDGLCKGNKTHYYDGMNSPSRLFSLAKKAMKKLEDDIDLENAKAGAFREMGGGMIESSGGRPNRFVK